MYFVARPADEALPSSPNPRVALTRQRAPEKVVPDSARAVRSCGVRPSAGLLRIHQTEQWREDPRTPSTPPDVYCPCFVWTKKRVLWFIVFPHARIFSFGSCSCHAFVKHIQARSNSDEVQMRIDAACVSLALRCRGGTGPWRDTSCSLCHVRGC